MSKSWIKALKRPKTETSAVPRSQEDIRKAHSDLCMKLGHAQYQVKFFKQVVENLLNDLTSLDAEAGARKQLDDQVKSEEQPKSGAV